MARPKASNEVPAGSIDLGLDAPQVRVEPDAPAPALDAKPEAKPKGKRGRAAPKVSLGEIEEHSGVSRVSDDNVPGFHGMDGSDINVDVPQSSFLDGQAGEDRKKAKARHVDDGLKAVAEMVDRMRKGLAYAACLHDYEAKLTVLSEVADTAESVTEDARRAVEAARKEHRNLQPAPKAK